MKFKCDLCGKEIDGITISVFDDCVSSEVIDGNPVYYKKRWHFHRNCQKDLGDEVLFDICHKILNNNYLNRFSSYFEGDVKKAISFLKENC